MCLGAGTSIEHPALGLDETGCGVQFNVSLGNRCALTKKCGDRCFLNVVQPNGSELDDETRWKAIEEIFDAGYRVRHCSLLEKEPFEHPRMMQRILGEFHRRKTESRPQAIGAISNGLTLHRNDWLADSPLSWILVSLDGRSASHRRGSELWDPAFQGLMRVKRRRGAILCGVNSVLTEDTYDSVLSLARLLNSEGISYLGICPWMAKGTNGEMVSQLSPERTRDLYERLANDLAGGSDLTVMFEMSPDAFHLVSGVNPYRAVAGPWRLQYRAAGTRLTAATMSPEPGRFFRLRFDGMLLDQTDLMTIGVVETRYGRFHPGKITRLLTGVETAWRSGQPWEPCVERSTLEVAR